MRQLLRQFVKILCTFWKVPNLLEKTMKKRPKFCSLHFCHDAKFEVVILNEAEKPQKNTKLPKQQQLSGLNPSFCTMVNNWSGQPRRSQSQKSPKLKWTKFTGATAFSNNIYKLYVKDTVLDLVLYLSHS